MKIVHLRKLLQESPVIRPGQEARAWAALRERMASEQPGSLLAGVWPLWLGATALVALAGLFFLHAPRHIYIASTDSRLSGVSASSFYSESAQAQVVWLEGMAPASEGLTAQDPTTTALNDAALSNLNP